MNKIESLKEVERRAYRSTFQDGFYEMLWGGIFLIFAWIPLLESFGISRFYCYPVVLIMAVVPLFGKRFVTTPRLGAVEFGAKRKARKRFTALISLIAVMLMLPLVVVMYAQGLLDEITWQAVALIAAPVIAIGVIMMNYSRMYLYAVLFLFSITSSEFLLKYIGWIWGSFISYGLPGFFILCYGFFLLVRFLREYPKPVEEAPDAH